jgi:hypothetical protein
MNKISYTNLKLKLNTEVNTFDFGGNQIEVLKYLPLEDKYSLINVTLQSAKENAIYNSLKLEAYFHLYLVMMYTNISFTEKQKEDKMKLYDILKSNGLIDKVLENMEEEEYNFLCESLNQQENDILNYQNTTAGVLSNIIENLPINAEEMQKIVDGFDQEKFQNVLNFAKSVNNGNLVM